MKMLCSLALGCLLMLAPARADSPLTSTDFWIAYRELPQVLMAHDLRRLNNELGNYLLSSAPLDRKAAVVNALSWNYEMQQNAPLFLERLQQKYAGQADRRMSPDEALCLGYLTALDHYKDPAVAQPLLTRAHRQLPRSFTAQIVYALLQAQTIFGEQDKMWARVAPVFADKRLKQDMRPDARRIIFDYMKLYKPH